MSATVATLWPRRREERVSPPECASTPKSRRRRVATERCNTTSWCRATKAPCTCGRRWGSTSSARFQERFAIRVSDSSTHTSCTRCSEPIVAAADDYLALLDWRRQVADMYRDVRARLGANPIDAHAYWRRRRDDLFRNHPQSALSAERRAQFGGLHYFDYDPRFAFTAPIRPLPEVRYDVAASDGRIVPMLRIGAVDLPIGTLEILWIDSYGGGVFLPFSDATAA